MGLGPATGRSSVLFGLRHGTISGPTTRPHKSGGRTRAASSRARETAAAAAGTRGKREARRKERGRADEVKSQASSASPARLGTRCELVAGEEWPAQAGGRPAATSERAAKEPRRASRPAAAAGPQQGRSSKQHSPGERVGGRAGEQTLR
jgi:hypothetical protein